MKIEYMLVPCEMNFDRLHFISMALYGCFCKSINVQLIYHNYKIA